MPLPRDQAWFPAKTYGWGWGIPCRWQGWLVMVLYVGSLFAGTKLIVKGAAYFVLYVLSLSLLLGAIGWWKGETPHWSWGKDE